MANGIDELCPPDGEGIHWVMHSGWEEAEAAQQSHCSSVCRIECALWDLLGGTMLLLACCWRWVRAHGRPEHS